MKQSTLFFRSLKESPKEAKIISHNLLVRASFIDQVSAGIWSFLPLGFRVLKKIEDLIRREMNRINGQQLLLPSLQPKELWVRSGRWHKMEPPLYAIKDQHHKEFALGPTHEEVITDLVSRFINSYKQLPLYLYQIQNKFRNEIRVSGGLLRVKEFIMKDLYSFHADAKDLDDYYEKVVTAYKNIFRECDLNVEVVRAHSGSIGGSYNHEFMVSAQAGEDKYVKCENCGYASNLEAIEDKSDCPDCHHKLKIMNGIECAHTFKLGLNYSEKMKASFIDASGKSKFIQMGCYGLGLGRLMATIIENCHDEHGMIWPKTVSPFQVHLLDLSTKNADFGQQVYAELKSHQYDVLYDERNVTAAIKLKDADLIGIPVRLVVSDKTKDQIEMKLRKEQERKIYKMPEIFEVLKHHV